MGEIGYWPAAIPFVFFVAILGLQQWLPRRQQAKKLGGRFIHNLLLFVLNLLIFSLIPLTLLGTAVFVGQHQFGLFNVLDWPLWLELLFAVIILDFAVYWQHVASHRWEWFWALHKVHHLDKEFDVSTAVRFHPLELLLSLFYKSAWVALLGASVQAVILFELLLIMGAAFSHANWRLPLAVDAVLRKVIVTPDVHRVHHSVYREEHDNNYGFFLIWWDKLFATYRQQPKEGHQDMQIGLQQERSDKICSRLPGLLMVPLGSSSKLD